MSSSIIWDFDGTIADSLPLVIELAYDWFKLEPLAPSEIERLRNLPIKELLAYVNLPLWRVPGLLVRARGEFGRRADKIDAIDGIPQVLEQLHKAGHKQYIISSNSPQNIRKFLRAHNLHQYFDSVHGNTGLFGKTAALRHIIKKDKLAVGDCYAIGDEARDIDAAQKVGVKSIAVNWGYNGDKILKQHKPDYFVTEPVEILKLLQ